MILQVLVYAVSSALLATAGLVLVSYVQNRLALARFKKQTNGMPLVDGVQPWLGNHVLWPIKEQLCNVLLEEFARHECKTLGWMNGQAPAVVTIDLDLMKTIVLDEPQAHINRFKINVPAREYEESIMLARDDKWRKLRRYFAPALKPAKFKTPNVREEIESSIGKLIAQIERKLDEKEEQQFHLDDLVHKYALNVVFSCFYKQYNLIDFNDPKCHWTERVDEGLESFQSSLFVKLSIFFPQLKSTIDWLCWHLHSQGAWRQAIMHFVKLQTKLGLEARKQAQELTASNANLNVDNFVLKDGTKFRRNMVDTVIDHFLDGKLTQSEFFDTSCFLVGAADKTASDCLVYTLYLLAIHQDVQTRLRAAVRADGTEAEYLSWVLNESLRLIPPAPIGCSRTVTRDFKLDTGHVLPANTFVVCCAHTVHRLKEYWGEDAEEFKPDRWRDTSHHHPIQYIPFGAGIRGCPGKEFALHEMKLVLVALLTRYHFKCEPKDDIQQFNSPFLIFVIPKTPTHMTIRRLADDE